MGYLGSKNGDGVFQAIISLMPPHDTYIEPFAGTAAILRRKAPALRSLALDLDAAMVEALPDLPGLTKRRGCALELLRSPDFPAPDLGRVLIYADPPYLHATRTSRHRYKHELTDSDHVDLARALAALPRDRVAVILSGYPNAIYDRELQGWNTLEFQAMTRGGVRTEKLWFNFEPSAVHWATYAGRDFTDRQRIKRKAARWAEKFADLPPGERQAVLAALLATQARPLEQA